MSDDLIKELRYDLSRGNTVEEQLARVMTTLRNDLASRERVVRALAYANESSLKGHHCTERMASILRGDAPEAHAAEPPNRIEAGLRRMSEAAERIAACRNHKDNGHDECDECAKTPRPTTAGDHDDPLE